MDAQSRRRRSPPPRPPLRRAIIFIPGLKRIERNRQRDKLVKNLLVNEQIQLHGSTGENEEVKLAGVSGVRLTCTGLRKEGKPPFETLDIFEAYWGDQLSVDAEQKPFVRVTRGFSLLRYWFLSPIWRAFSTASWQIAAALLLGGVALVVWYLSIIITVSDLWFDPKSQIAPAASAVNSTLPWLGGLITAVLLALMSWKLWSLVALLIPVTPVMVTVDHAQAVRVLLTNTHDEHGVGRRSRVRKTVGDVVGAVAEASSKTGAPDYDDIILVAHGFGTIILIDLLADWPHQSDLRRLSVVTLGSPQSVLAARSAWLRKETGRLLDAHPVEMWIDVSGDDDYFSAPIDGHVEAYGEASQLRFKLDQGGLPLSTKAHDAYLSSPEVLKLLVEPIGAPRTVTAQKKKSA